MRDIETVGDLIDALGNGDRNTPLRVAVQPNYPMSATLIGVVFHGSEAWLAVSDNEDYDVPRGLHASAEYGF
jgi:hypothetical protein